MKLAKNKKSLQTFTKQMQSLQTRSTLLIIILAAVLVEGASMVQYWYASKKIGQEVRQRAETELRAKSLEIQNQLQPVEVATQNIEGLVARNIHRPDTLKVIIEKWLDRNPSILGLCICFEANYFPERGRWYEPYTLRRSNGKYAHMQLGSASHDYLSSDWYLQGLKAMDGRWSEPYMDAEGARAMVCTYTFPLHDRSGNLIGILGSDVSLEWLSRVVNATHIYPSSFNLLVSREGTMMVSPVDSFVMRVNLRDATSKIKDAAIHNLNERILSGESGHAVIRNEQGEREYVFFAPVKGNTGWSMAVVCSHKEIYSGLRSLLFRMLMLLLAGLALLSFIIYRAIKSFKHIEEVNAVQNALANELNIASDIQMSMLPKTYPPFPDRDDIDIYGFLTPAKAVGGDLFDFFIRNEKLFFCIGDVSGKGVPASLVMAVVRSLFRSVASHEASPERIIAHINDLSVDNESNMFVTMFVGVLDLPKGLLRYCNAGHDAPLLISKDVRSLPVEPNLPLGVVLGWQFKGGEIQLDYGTTIFLYTDGLAEAEDIAHNQFRRERIIKEAEDLKDAEGMARPEPLITRMSDAVQSFVGEAEQSDDLTMLALQYTKEHHAALLTRSLTLTNDLKQIEMLPPFVEEVCKSLGFDGAATMKMNLAIEEAVANIINYAYPKGQEGTLHIDAEANDERLKFTISDNGSPFDPTAREDVDISLPADKRPIGGLGIFLVRQLMDSINYERVDGQNVLTLRKKLEPTQ